MTTRAAWVLVGLAAGVAIGGGAMAQVRSLGRDEAGVRLAVEVAKVREVLSAAPGAGAGEAIGERGAALTLVMPDGELCELRAAESSVMEAGLQAKYPEVRSYVVQTMDRTMNGRVDVSGHGLSAMVRSERGVWVIDAEVSDPSRARSYWLHEQAKGMDWACETMEGLHGEAAHAGESTRADRGVTMKLVRTVRLAMACTGEYGLHQCTIRGHAPNVADPIAQMALVVSRSNVVYESDLGVHFVLVNGNDQVVYVDPVTDPYPDSCDGTGGADCSGPYLQPNVANLGSVIGNANYDVGHLLTRVFGGVAYLSSVCTGNKGGGISGIARGGDVNDLSYLVVIHELGHQFGASHTFSGTRGRCGNNATLSSAWEAGSGSSPMAYAGGCPVGDAPPSDNVAIFADPYFHHGSVAQMNTFLASGTASCLTAVSSANVEPEFVSLPGNRAIPPGTAFELSAQATDGNGDALVYSWEQFDSGVRRPLSGTGSEDNGQGALFRVYPPVSAGTRTFPKMADVLAGVAVPGEQLPAVTGVTRRFRCIVRDNAPGAGAAVISAFTDLTIATNTTAFSVTGPSAGAVLNAGMNTVTWNVGNTTAAPVSCASVRVRLSKDGGATFAEDLGTFANTGSASVRMVGPTSAARVRVEAVGNVFFAVSRGFEVGACPGDFNQSGEVSTQDLFDYLAAWFAGSASADVNGQNGVSVQDIFDFLARWFATC